MGEFRDIGIPAQVVKKNPAQAAKPQVQDFFFATRAGIPMSLYSPIQERYSSMSHYIINIFLDFLISRDFFRQTAATSV
jgi:hypothetical protein